MTKRRHGPGAPPVPGDPGQPIREGLAEAASRLLAERLEHTARDTLADESAEDFLDALDQALWLLEQSQDQTAAHSFTHAARPTEHIEDLRRLLYRLHLVLTSWESTPTTP